MTLKGPDYTIGTDVAAIRTLLLALLILFPTRLASGEVIYRAEEDDGSISFTHYNNRDDLEVYIDDELANRPAEMANIDPEKLYRNLDKFDDLIVAAADRHGLDPALVKAVMLVESGFNPEAVSPKGALGLMQLMPATAREVGVTDAFDPAQNIEGGTAYLRRMVEHFGGNRPKAIAAYNAGPGAVVKHGGTPPFEETQFFVRNVTKMVDYFSYDRPIGRSR